VQVRGGGIAGARWASIRWQEKLQPRPRVVANCRTERDAGIAVEVLAIFGRIAKTMSMLMRKARSLSA
jgi:hypothetical protein